MSSRQNLQRQLEEIESSLAEALQSVYQSGDLTFSGAEQACLASAHEVLHCNSGSDSLLATQLEELSNVAGSIRLPEVRVEGQPAFLRFQLPASYPDTSARLRVESEGPREVLDEVASDLATFATDCQGQEALLVCVDHACTLLNSRIEQGRIHRQAPAPKAPSEARKPAAPVLKHAVIWFHHISSPQKRKHMAEWSHELHVGGFAKIGYPGVVMLEGAAEDVDEYIVRLRAQHWKAMAVRGEREARFSDMSALDAARHFDKRLRELSDKELGVLAVRCREAGLEDLFLTALKIEKS